MKPLELAGWRPVLTALCIWFAHFMLCWAVAEIWPGQAIARALAWGFTAVALLALGLHALRLRAAAPRGELTGWSRRFAWGATAIATVAVLFVALPPFLLRT